MKKNIKILDRQTKEKIKNIWAWAYRLRSLVLGIPVAVAAVILALHNQIKLPKMVGINLLVDGEYAYMVAKGIAVFGPLAVTALCLLLVFCSRKVLFPWLVSVFSLTLPLLIYLLNAFSA